MFIDSFLFWVCRHISAIWSAVFSIVPFVQLRTIFFGGGVPVHLVVAGVHGGSPGSMTVDQPLSVPTKLHERLPDISF